MSAGLANNIIIILASSLIGISFRGNNEHIIIIMNNERNIKKRFSTSGETPVFMKSFCRPLLGKQWLLGGIK